MIRAAASTGSGRIRPYAATTSKIGRRTLSARREIPRVRIFAGLSTGSPRRAATAPTSLGSEPEPAPARLIGTRDHADDLEARLSTHAAASTSRSRMWAASAGVPMKTILNGVGDFRSGRWRAAAPSALPSLISFCEFAPVEFALDPADAIDEELAVEMIDLMLQRDREQVVRLDLDLLLVGRPRAHQHARRAFHVGGVIDHRQASLFPNDRTLGLDDLGIDQLAADSCRDSRWSVSSTTMRCESPTCGAARPTPGAAYIVCTMLSMKPVEVAVDILDRLGRLLERASGNLRILSSAIVCEYSGDFTNVEYQSASKLVAASADACAQERFHRADAFVGTLDLKKVRGVRDRFVSQPAVSSAIARPISAGGSLRSHARVAADQLHGTGRCAICGHIVADRDCSRRRAPRSSRGHASIQSPLGASWRSVARAISS